MLAGSGGIEGDHVEVSTVNAYRSSSFSFTSGPAKLHSSRDFIVKGYGKTTESRRTFFLHTRNILANGSTICVDFSVVPLGMHSFSDSGHGVESVLPRCIRTSSRLDISAGVKSNMAVHPLHIHPTRILALRRGHFDHPHRRRQSQQLCIMTFRMCVFSILELCEVNKYAIVLGLEVIGCTVVKVRPRIEAQRAN